jgi:hypothetical protein
VIRRAGGRDFQSTNMIVDVCNKDIHPGVDKPNMLAQYTGCTPGLATGVVPKVGLLQSGCTPLVVCPKGG